MKVTSFHQKFSEKKTKKIGFNFFSEIYHQLLAQMVVLSKTPPVGGVWVFSGPTHLKFL